MSEGQNIYYIPAWKDRISNDHEGEVRGIHFSLGPSAEREGSKHH